MGRAKLLVKIWICAFSFNNNIILRISTLKCRDILKRGQLKIFLENVKLYWIIAVIYTVPDAWYSYLPYSCNFCMLDMEIIFRLFGQASISCLIMVINNLSWTYARMDIVIWLIRMVIVKIHFGIVLNLLETSDNKNLFENYSDLFKIQ